MFCRNCGSEMNPNQAICLKCGVEKGKGNSYCASCGNAVFAEAVICVHCGVPIKKPSGVNSAAASRVCRREIVKAIIFSVLTCGIYAIYWFVALTNEMNLLSGNEKDTAGGTAFLLTLITCGIYGFYWAYRMGVKRDQLEGKKDGSSAILYLVLMIFGLGIVAYALMQDAINKAIEKA